LKYVWFTVGDTRRDSIDASSEIFPGEFPLLQRWPAIRRPGGIEDVDTTAAGMPRTWMDGSIVNRE
jgi:hypothetical protein